VAIKPLLDTGMESDTLWQCVQSAITEGHCALHGLRWL
jgi:hypothetical protein